jgi:hypothetical protein
VPSRPPPGARGIICLPLSSGVRWAPGDPPTPPGGFRRDAVCIKITKIWDARLSASSPRAISNCIYAIRACLFTVRESSTNSSTLAQTCFSPVTYRYLHVCTLYLNMLCYHTLKGPAEISRTRILRYSISAGITSKDGRQSTHG